MVPKGFYNLPVDAALTAQLRRLGLEVRVVCAGRDSGLDFGVDAQTPEGRAAQRRAYHSLGVQLDCVQPIGGSARIMAPQPVPDPRLLADHELIQPAQGIGFMAGTNRNPACLGMTMTGTNITGVASCQSFGDSPSIWSMYTGTCKGLPFVITGVLKAPWFMTSRQVVRRYFEFVADRVTDMGVKYLPENFYAWMSPAGFNTRITDDQAIAIMEAGDYEEYIGFKDSAHTLDVVGLTQCQMFEAGMPDANLTCLREDTATARAAGGMFRWDSEQRDGHEPKHSIVAGVVREINR